MDSWLGDGGPAVTAPPRLAYPGPVSSKAHGLLFLTCLSGYLTRSLPRRFLFPRGFTTVRGVAKCS